MTPGTLIQNAVAERGIAMHVTFHGAAREVTGSQHLVTTPDRRILLDCGLYQGDPIEVLRRNLEDLPFASELDAVILSHAHVDHCGRLPLLFRAGFRGPVFGSRLTLQLAELMLQDNLRIQLESGTAGDSGIDPQADLRGLVQQFEPLETLQWHQLGDDVRLRFLPAGHIPGAMITELDLEENGDWRRLVYTGDLGRAGMPLVSDPFPVERCDLLICESTYGNRVHPSLSRLEEELVAVINRTRDRDGCVLIPAFSLGRTQQLMFILQRLFEHHHLDPLPVAVDSPLAGRVTAVLEQEIPEFATARAAESSRWIESVDTPQASLALRSRTGPRILISASGMCDAGRIQFHLPGILEDPRNTVLFAGFQAQGTLGRQLVNRSASVQIRDQTVAVHAEIERLDGFSSHADAHDLVNWTKQLARSGGAGRICLVHGEESASQALALALKEFSDEPVIIPERGETIEF